MVADNLPAPVDVVKLFTDKGIAAMRLYEPNTDALTALKGSPIEVMLGVRNEDLASIAGSQAAADDWVHTNVAAYSDVKIKYITAGNEVIPGPNSQYVLPAMQNLLKSLTAASLSSSIRVSTVVSMSVLGSSYPPSQGAFSDVTAAVMSDIVSFLSSNGSPFLANVYPYFAYTGSPGQIALPYALFAGDAPVVQDGALSYHNLFDAMVDALYSALEKAGGSSVGIVISESGWPSAGSDAATVANAQAYVNNFISHVTSGDGTPKRPGKPIEAYVFAMFNENQKPGEAVEQNFGLFYPSMQPVYPVFN
ncbi:glucan endo-1,3-beta-glucosidase-like [Nymphaea colorata]|uniref:Glucan endo-1,3-beta-D-glucosidase n=1 Tax=Nymphaea colorata TaxID=210225 RepID=A0A5K0X1S7_9MAGN|nr:glucan endo-1,3-beta-glucosidase-like [Nymphaea colorata]